MGFGRKNADTVLRGLVQSKVVYPGDVIVLHPNWELEVFENAVFQERYEEPDEVIVLTDGQDDPPIDWEKFIPRGDAVDSILLEELPSALPDPIQGVGMKTSYQDEMAPMPDDPQPGPQAVDDPPDDNDEDDDDLEDEEDDE
jgi:hypothetical protein